LALLLLTGNVEQHFALSLKPGISNKKLKKRYSKEELSQICNLLSTLNKKLNDKNGDYRELGYESSIYREKNEE